MLYRKPQSSNSDKDKLPFNRTKPLAGPGSYGPLSDGRLGKEGQEVEIEEGRRTENGERTHTGKSFVVLCLLEYHTFPFNHLTVAVLTMCSHIDAAASVMMMMMRWEEKEEEEGPLQRSCLIREDKELLGVQDQEGGLQCGQTKLKEKSTGCGAEEDIKVLSEYTVYDKKGLAYYSNLGKTVAKLFN